MITTINHSRTDLDVPPGLLVQEIGNDLTRREFLIGAGGLLALGVAGCGNGGGASDGEDTSAEKRTTGHKYGSTEIEGVPERIVTVGYSDHDAVLALGIKPVGVRAFIGDRVIWPWNENEVGDAEPEVLSAEEIDFEKISTLKPGLITGVYSDLTEDEYDTLSEIAPTVAQSGEYMDLGTPWWEQTRVIGRLLGQKERAEQIVAEVKAQFAEARERHRRFEGSTLVLAALVPDGTYYLYGSRDPRVRVLTSLGFEIPAEVAELVGERTFATFSQEQLELVDTDVLIWQVNSAAQRETLEDDPLYRQLDVYSEGRDLFLVGFEPLRSALGLSTVLSLPFLLNELVPQLAAAADGDPRTEAEG